MNRNFRLQEGPGALETVEAAVHLLRSAPVATLATYYAGGLPFVLGFLYFWADMSRSPFAAQHAVAASLGLAVLFVWFKFWQALFARKLRAQLSGETPARLALARAGRILFTQMALQPTALIVLPLAMVLALPFPWLYAFYQSLTTQAEADTPTLRATIARSWRLALLWPAQNHVIFAVVGGTGLLWNHVLGPGCRAFVVTGVQTAELPALIRSKKARRVLARLQPLVNEIQSSLVAALTSAKAMSATGVPGVPPLVAEPRNLSVAAESGASPAQGGSSFPPGPPAVG